jgi:hypothetical protein
LEVADYHSGAQRGIVRILEGSRGNDWAKLESELWRFFLGREEKNPTGAVLVGVSVGGATTKIENSGFVGSSRNLRSSRKIVAPFT